VFPYALILVNLRWRLTVNQSSESAIPFSKNLRIAFIEARWHHDIVHQAYHGFVRRMSSFGVSAERVDVVEVPGSLEIPLRAMALAESGSYNLIVAAGLIVDGGIYRHDFVARTVLDAMMQVQLNTRVPLLSVVLTPHHFHESTEHHRFFFDHFVVKGGEAASACAQMLGLAETASENLTSAA
jgi:6,7-dimethyl-8-ribityllumazine synthase